ncbi:MAG: UDP-N-acetylmuramate--L-alanine ligase [Candidatus Roizmanbacteria bacterium]|nr:UDP-N-acetylmuramate--L-alanine ligase [Candidatus Roizmanbacteria bacterium]
MILDKSSFFLLGIKGTAMANIAIMLSQMGKQVSGVDVAEEFITDISLTKNNIQFSTDFSDTASVDNYEVFVYSAAHGGEESILAKEAQKKGKLLVSQPQLIAELVNKHTVSLAVSGCHGKTTTSSLLAWALTKLGKNPSFLIGAPPFDGGGGGAVTGSDYFVIEADEYAVHPPKDKTPKLLFLHPAYALCLNIDFDHPDVYDDLEMTKKTFVQFFSQAQHLVLCGEDPVIRSILPTLSHKSIVTYGFENTSDYSAKSIKYSHKTTEFEVYKKGEKLGVCSTELSGEKNVLNTLGVLALLLETGTSFEAAVMSIQGFRGAKRRFEQVWTDGASYLFDDYGHHPAEIEATIASVRSRFPGKKLHVLFQPHTFSRTQSLKHEFAMALSKADFTYIEPIFASAREQKELFKVTSFDVANEAQLSTVTAYNNPKDSLAQLAIQVQKGDVVLTMGAGDIYKLKDDIIDVLNEKSIR